MNKTFREWDDTHWQRALELMPKGTQTMSKCPDQFVDGVYPKFISRGKGAYLYTPWSERYLDYMCGLGPIILGYSNKKVNKAVKKQLKKGTIFSLPTLLEQKVAEQLIEVVPSLEQVRFCKNGSDATLAAVRIARSYTGKEVVLKPRGGYHGWGDWHAVSMNSNGIPQSLLELIDTFEYNYSITLEDRLKHGDVAAVIIEPQALTSPKPGFLEDVRRLCTEHKAILIFDEIVTGFRWSLGGAQEYFNISPDLTCLGKAVANGLPLAVIGGKKEYMKEMNKIFFSMTFGGETLSLAAAYETIKQLKKKDYTHLYKLGKELKSGILRVASKHLLKVDFQGDVTRFSIQFDSSYPDADGMKNLFFQEMVKQGILFPNVIYIQFSHTEGDILRTVAAADAAFEKVFKYKDSVDSVLEGKRSTSIFRKNN